MAPVKDFTPAPKDATRQLALAGGDWGSLLGDPFLALSPWGRRPHGLPLSHALPRMGHRRPPALPLARQVGQALRCPHPRGHTTGPRHAREGGKGGS